MRATQDECFLRLLFSLACQFYIVHTTPSIPTESYSCSPNCDYQNIRESYSPTRNSCTPGLSSPGWTEPSGDIAIRVGERLSILCTLNLNLESSEWSEYNASNIFFTRKSQKERIPQKYVTALNESTAELSIPNVSKSPTTWYYCCLPAPTRRLHYDADPTPISSASIEYPLPSDVEGSVTDVTVVCYNTVVVDDKPSQVQNLTCVSHNWEKLSCSWKPRENYVRTKYRIQYFVGKSKTSNNVGEKMACPNETDVTENKCEWNLSTWPQYRFAHEYLTVVVTGTNNYGISETTLLFDHFAKIIPAAPFSLTANETTSNGANVTWSIGRLNMLPNHILYNYSIQFGWECENKNLTSWHTVFFTKRNNEPLSYNLSVLPYPNTAYRIRLAYQLIKSDGNSVWSDYNETIATTVPSAPYYPPALDVGSFEIIHSYEDGRDVMLYWQAMTACLHNGPQFHYEIAVVDGSDQFVSSSRESQNDNITSRWISVDRFYAHFSKLSLDSSTFLVRSANELGHSSNHSVVTVPNFNYVMKLIENFTKRDVSQTTYELSWDAPKYQNVISDYTIFWCEASKNISYKCEDSASLNWTHVPAHLDRYTVVTSNKFKNIQFAISANSESSSSGMVWAKCTLSSDSVIELKNVWIIRAESQAIEIGWKLDCTDRASVINSYLVHYCQAESAEGRCLGPESSLNITAGVSQAFVNILRPFTSYKLSVSVVVHGTKGPRSAPLFGRTSEGAPDVDNLSVRIAEVNNSSVLLSWPRPTHMNGILRYYAISHNDSMRVVHVYNETKVMLKDLKSYWPYSIQVSACTSVCTSYPEVTLRTRIGTPGAVHIISVEKINKTLASITWSSPTVAAAPRNYYDIRVQRHSLYKESDVVFASNILSTNFNVSITGCEEEGEDTFYTFHVRARNVDESVQQTAVYVGNWSHSYAYHCNIYHDVFPLGYRLLVMLAVLCVCAASFLLCGKKGMYRCKRMKNVEVVLPNNFAIPSVFLNEHNVDNTYEIEVKMKSKAEDLDCSIGMHQLLLSSGNDIDALKEKSRKISLSKCGLSELSSAAAKLSFTKELVEDTYGRSAGNIWGGGGQCYVTVGKQSPSEEKTAESFGSDLDDKEREGVPAPANNYVPVQKGADRACAPDRYANVRSEDVTPSGNAFWPEN